MKIEDKCKHNKGWDTCVILPPKLTNNGKWAVELRCKKCLKDKYFRET